MIVKSNVVALLVKEFGVGNPDLANRDEKNLARALKAMFTFTPRFIIMKMLEEFFFLF